MRGCAAGRNRTGDCRTKRWHKGVSFQKSGGERWEDRTGQGKFIFEKKKTSGSRAVIGRALSLKPGNAGRDSVSGWQIFSTRWQNRTRSKRKRPVYTKHAVHGEGLRKGSKPIALCKTPSWGLSNDTTFEVGFAQRADSIRLFIYLCSCFADLPTDWTEGTLPQNQDRGSEGSLSAYRLILPGQPGSGETFKNTVLFCLGVEREGEEERRRRDTYTDTSTRTHTQAHM